MFIREIIFKCDMRFFCICKRHDACPLLLFCLLFFATRLSNFEKKFFVKKLKKSAVNKRQLLPQCLKYTIIAIYLIRCITVTIPTKRTFWIRKLFR